MPNKKTESKKKVKKLSKKQKIERLKLRESKLKKIIVAIIVLFIVLIALTILALLQQGIISNPFNKNTEIIEYDIKDECSLIVGNLIHTIEREEVCELRCKNNCDIREMNYVNHEFTINVNDCHTCKCNCI